MKVRKSTKRAMAFAAYRTMYLYWTMNYFRNALGDDFKRKMPW